MKLSPKQKWILELLAQGRKNAEIIEITGLSLNTIRTHTRVIYQKLEVNNAADAIGKAIGDTELKRKYKLGSFISILTPISYINNLFNPYE